MAVLWDYSLDLILAEFLSSGDFYIGIFYYVFYYVLSPYYDPQRVYVTSVVLVHL